MMRARASARATREVSMVIQRRPHCSAPPLVYIRGGAGAAGGVEDEVARVGGHEEAAFTEFEPVWTTYLLSCDVSNQILWIGEG